VPNLSTGTIAASNGFVLTNSVTTPIAATPTPTDGLGVSVSGAGDVNGDGLADVIVGAYGRNNYSGAAYVVYGKAGGTFTGLELSGGTIASSNGFAISSTMANSQLGNTVSSVGDINGDGYADVAVGAVRNDVSGTTNSAGAAYIIYGGSNVTSLSVGTGAMNASQGFRILGQSGSWLGGSSLGGISSAGDVNGDGLGDMIISAYGEGTFKGAVYVVYGSTTNSGTLDLSSGTIAASNGFKYAYSGTQNYRYGNAVAGAGDINGDGLDDLVVGAYTANNNAGAYHLILGGTQNVTTAINLTGTSADEAVMGTAGNDVLTGNGGVDRFFAGRGSDTIVLQASDATNLASNSGATRSTADGGQGFDTIRLTAGMTLDLTAVTNAGAMGLEENSRIESIERIDMATDTTANTLTLTAKDVADMADFNSIRLGASDDGKTWTNVSGTALKATTKFHQVVVDGTSADTLNLEAGNGSWFNMGEVSNGSTNYVVYQNTAMNSQVIVDKTVVVNNKDVDPLIASLMTIEVLGITPSSTSGVYASFTGAPTYVAGGTVTVHDSATGAVVLTRNSWDAGSFTNNFVETGMVVGHKYYFQLNYPDGASYRLKNSVQYNGSSTQATQVDFLTSPLVLDLNGDGVQTLDRSQDVLFDLNNTGDKQKVSWIDKQDGLLVVDLNGDGQVNSGAELLGSSTKLANGSVASDGWAALAGMDTNLDGVIDAKDANFDKLRVWVDADADGATDAGELKTLAEADVASIDLNHDNSVTQQNGNVLQGVSKYTTASGATRDVVDVWLQATPVTAEVPVDANTQVSTEVTAEVTAEDVAAAIAVCTAAAESSTYSLSNGQSLDLTTVLKDMSFNGIVKGLEQVDMATDATANVVSLTLADVLSMPTTDGVHKLVLTGAANDKVMLVEAEWTDTGTVINQAGHNYAVYTGTSDPSAQLLIDQQMLQSHQTS